MRSRDTDLLFIPGLGEAGSDHWLSRWQAKLPTARRVAPAPSELFDRGAWVEVVSTAVASARQPVVVVAHSVGVAAFMAAVVEGLPPPAGAFLVSPPSEAALRGLPQVDPAFLPWPKAPLGFPALVVGSRADQHAAQHEMRALAEDWGATFLDAGEAGHIDAASGHGPWPEGLMAFGGFLGKL